MPRNSGRAGAVERAGRKATRKRKAASLPFDGGRAPVQDGAARGSLRTGRRVRGNARRAGASSRREHALRRRGGCVAGARRRLCREGGPVFLSGLFRSCLVRLRGCPGPVATRWAFLSAPLLRAAVPSLRRLPLRAGSFPAGAFGEAESCRSGPLRAWSGAGRWSRAR